MPTTKKVEIVKNLTENLKKAKSFVLSDYQGLTTSQLNPLKNEVEKSNSKMIIAKNTLIDMALKAVKIKIDRESLKGPTAVLFNFEESLNSLKSLVSFGKISGRPKVKLGFFEGQVLSAEQVLAMADLPSREILLTRLLSLLNSPRQRLLLSLKSDQQKLLVLLNEKSKWR